MNRNPIATEQERSGPQPLLRCSELTIGYNRKALLPAIGFEVGKGEFLALVGPNGAGKTTLLHTLLGLTRPLSGEVWRASTLRIGYVPQRGLHDPIFPLSALDVVRGGGSLTGRPLALATRHSAMSSLGQVGLASLAGRLFRELSGGQQQRVLLARALVREPDLLALDEPTAGMDIPSERELMELVHHLSIQRSMAVLLVTHQLYLAARHAQRIALINSELGRFLVGTTPTLMTSQRLTEFFGQPMQVLEAQGVCWVVALGQEAST